MAALPPCMLKHYDASVPGMLFTLASFGTGYTQTPPPSPWLKSVRLVGITVMILYFAWPLSYSDSLLRWKQSLSHHESVPQCLGRQRNIYYVSQNLTTKWFKPVGFKATSKMPQAKVLTVGNHSKSRVTDRVCTDSSLLYTLDSWNSVFLVW